jgi:hypothetical protein
MAVGEKGCLPARPRYPAAAEASSPGKRHPSRRDYLLYRTPGEAGSGSVRHHMLESIGMECGLRAQGKQPSTCQVTFAGLVEAGSVDRQSGGHGPAVALRHPGVSPFGNLGFNPRHSPATKRHGPREWPLAAPLVGSPPPAVALVGPWYLKAWGLGDCIVSRNSLIPSEYPADDYGGSCY